jgi:hypothetical protein
MVIPAANFRISPRRIIPIGSYIIATDQLEARKTVAQLMPGCELVIDYTSRCLLYENVA